MPGVTHDLMLTGVSVTRNEKLAQVFYRLSIIEAFGTGIPRVFGAYENSDVKPEIPVIDGGFLIRIPNINYEILLQTAHDRVLKFSRFTNERKLLTTLQDVSFTKEDAARVLEITASGAYKLLQRMTERGLLVARKEGNTWVYNCISTQGE
jgi:ATP-dependent DNA helicase RecG